MSGSVNFNRVAPVYDNLAKLIFGRSILRSHLHFLNYVSASKNILVLGGGSGEFLPSLLKINQEGRIYYIDLSSTMLARARRRVSESRVEFILGTEQSIPPEVRFDAVLTFFYLDLFEGSELKGVLEIIKKALQPTARWLVADFADNGKWWHITVVKFMYLFFRFSTGLTTRRLPDWRTELKQAGFQCSGSKSFYSRFIESAVYDSL